MGFLLELFFSQRGYVKNINLGCPGTGVNRQNGPPLNESAPGVFRHNGYPLGHRYQTNTLAGFKSELFAELLRNYDTSC